MKAERRHELKENALAKKLVQMPSLYKQHGTKVILGALVVAVVTVLVVQHFLSRSAQYKNAQAAISSAQQDLSLLNGMVGDIDPDPSRIAAGRLEYFNDGLTATKNALDLIGDREPVISAQAYVTRGDIYFAMANLPDLPGTDKHGAPSAGASTADLLKSAQESYTTVLNQFPGQTLQVVAARFGLGAISENRAAAGDELEWAKARQQYNTLIGDKTLSPIIQRLASIRLENLSRYVRAPRAEVAPPVTMPSSRPDTQPVELPGVTRPSSLPSAPTTYPSLPPIPTTTYPSLPPIPAIVPPTTR